MMRDGAWRMLFLCAVLCAASPTCADRDIVYAARYYYPPGSRAASYWHLYRINPDGSGRIQLTHGRWDDFGPVWSPDGKKIACMRAKREISEYFWAGKQTLCLVGARGGRITKLMYLGQETLAEYRWSPDGRTIAILVPGSEEPVVSLMDVKTRKVRRLKGASSIAWCPDGRRMYVAYGKSGDKIIDVTTGKSTSVVNSVKFPVWVDPKTVVGVVDAAEEADSPLRIISADGKERKLVRVGLATKPGDRTAINGELEALLPVAGHRRAVVYVLNRHNSTVDILYQFFLVDIDTGKSRELAYGQFLAWSPDGKRFCTAPGRDLGPYGKRPDGTERRVWIAPLQTGSVKSGRLRTITPGTVWVVGADWR